MTTNKLEDDDYDDSFLDDDPDASCLDNEDLHPNEHEYEVRHKIENILEQKRDKDILQEPWLDENIEEDE